MAVLGKRKARAAEAPTVDDAERQNAQDIFRQYFESQFEPLPDAKPAPENDEEEEDQDEDDSEDDEWGGLSEDDEVDDGDEDEDEDEKDEDLPTTSRKVSRGGSKSRKVDTVEVVDHSTPNIPKTEAMSKRELKAFMSSRPIDYNAPTTTTTETSTTSSKTPSTLPEDAPSLLAQDLELRRLISESHLFNRNISSNLTPNADANQPKLFASGRTRAKALDLRVQALGSKDSVFKQDKMSMRERKGRVAAQQGRETKRRKEAKESGIVLEKEKFEKGGKGKKRTAGAREMGVVDRPGVGRLRGAELKISDRDVQSIENTRDTFGRKRR